VPCCAVTNNYKCIVLGTCATTGCMEPEKGLGVGLGLGEELTLKSLHGHAVRSIQGYLDAHVHNVMHDVHAILTQLRAILGNAKGTGFAKTEPHNDIYYQVFVTEPGGSCQVSVQAPEAVQKMMHVTPEPEEYRRARRRVEDVKYVLHKRGFKSVSLTDGQRCYGLSDFVLEMPPEYNIDHRELARQKLHAVLGL
jgi:hypothetical protein